MNNAETDRTDLIKLVQRGGLVIKSNKGWDLNADINEPSDS